MKNARVLAALAGTALLWSLPARSQSINPGLPDPFRLTEPKNFEAFRSSSNNEDWNSNDDSKRTDPGRDATSSPTSRGPGVVTHMWVDVRGQRVRLAATAPPARVLRRQRRCRRSTRRSATSSRVGPRLRGAVKSLMIRQQLRRPRPQQLLAHALPKSCRITVTNEGRRRVHEPLLPRGLGEAARRCPPDTPYFHARYRQSLPAPADGSPYVFLDAKGKRHYVGTVFSVVQAEAGLVRRGRRLLLGRRRSEALDRGHRQRGLLQRCLGPPRQRRRLLRRHRGGGHGARVPHDGVPLAPRRSRSRSTNRSGPRSSTRAGRSTPTARSKSGFGERVDLISSVAFWYQQGIAADQPRRALRARRDCRRATPCRSRSRRSCPRSKPRRARSRSSRTSSGPRTSWSSRAEGPGSQVDVPFDVPEDGDYELYVQIAQGLGLRRLHGPARRQASGRARARARARRRRPAAERSSTATRCETYVGADYQVGWPRLTKGRHTLTFQCLGKREDSSGYVVGVDDIVLAKTGAAAWAAAVKLQEPRVPTGA